MVVKHALTWLPLKDVQYVTSYFGVRYITSAQHICLITWCLIDLRRRGELVVIYCLLYNVPAFPKIISAFLSKDIYTYKQNTDTLI